MRTLHPDGDDAMPDPPETDSRSTSSRAREDRRLEGRATEHRLRGDDASRSVTGATNVPKTDSDRTIMMLTQSQLLQTLRGMSPCDRHLLLTGSTGWFQKRVAANLRDFGLEHKCPELRKLSRAPGLTETITPAAQAMARFREKT